MPIDEQPRSAPEDGTARPVRRRRRVAVAILVVLLATIGLIWLASSGGPPSVEDVRTTLNQPGNGSAMQRSLIGIWSITLLLLPVALSVLWVVWLYNGLVDKEEQVRSAWAQVESNYQRRADLIPNLVRTIQRYLRHEGETLAQVTEQRGPDLAPLTEALDRLRREQERAEALEEEEEARPGGPGEAGLRRFADALAGVDASVRRLFAVAENYPTLRSADQFLELQAQLEGTENRINVARVRFNEAVAEFNSSIRMMPASLVAGMGNFRRKAYFEAEDGTEAVPELRFE